jgi:hypothetical protein
MLISVEGTGKNLLEPGQETMGDAPMLLQFSLLRNPWLNPTGVLEHCREGEINSTFFGAFPSDQFHKATKDVNVCFFIHSSDFFNPYPANVEDMVSS